MKLALLLALLLASPASAAVTVIQATLPTRIAALVPYTLPDGSLTAIPSCDVGPDSCVDLSLLRLYGQPSTGGGWRLLRAHQVAGRQGQVDTFQVDPGTVGWHLYVATVDSTGNESCPSNSMYLGTTTGVGDPVLINRIVSVRLFDVHGHLVKRLTGSGIYYELTRWQDGTKRVRKKVLLK